MKSTITGCMFIILIMYIPTILSTSNIWLSRYNLLRDNLNSKANSKMSPRRKFNELLVSDLNLNLSSKEGKNHKHIRENWDSGEDYYFQWANRNRRPVEYFMGRKREAPKPNIPKRRRYDHEGLWLSGLVG